MAPALCGALGFKLGGQMRRRVDGMRTAAEWSRPGLNVRLALAIALTLVAACAHVPPAPVTEQEIERVKISFEDAIREDLVRTRRDQNLANVRVDDVAVREQGNGLQIGYRVAFDEQLADGEVVTHEFIAEAKLERDGNGWKATKLKPQSQTLTFQKGMVVRPGAEAPPASSSE